MQKRLKAKFGAKETVERMKRLRNQFSVHAAGQQIVVVVVLQKRQKSTKEEEEKEKEVLEK